MICLSNLASTEASVLADEIAEIVLSARFPERETAVVEHESSSTEAGLAPAPSGTDNSRWIGVFRREGPKSYVVIQERDDELLLCSQGSEYPLELLTPTSAVLTGLKIPVELRLGEESSPTQLLIGGGAPRFLLPSASSDDAELQRYVGTFFCEELDVEYHVVKQGRQLWLHLPIFEPVALSIGAANEFFTDVGWILVFSGNGDGEADSFTIETSRVSGLSFERGSPCDDVAARD